MEQDQFQIYGGGIDYQPVAQPDLLPAIDREQSRQKQADEEFLAQIRRNNQTRVQNAKSAGQDLIALGKFSKTLVDALVTNQKQQNEEDLAAGLEEGYRQYMNGGLDMSSYNQGMSTAKQQDAVASEVESDVQRNNPDNYEASANIGKATTWKEVGRRRGFAQAAVGGYSTYIDQQLAGKQFNSSSEYASALSQARQSFFRRAGLTGMNPKFLAETVYPSLQKTDASLMRKWTKQFAVDDSFARQSDASSTLVATKDISSYLDAVRSTVDKNGNPLGYAGAWSSFEQEITRAREAGMLTESDLVNMENQAIPGDPKGRTYGELYATRFGKIRRQVAAQRRQDWNNEEADRKIEFQQAEQQLVDAFLDSSDTDGFTDEQIDDAIEVLRDTYGIESSELATLKKSTVDAKQRDQQEEQIENLIASNLLTTERLKKFDPQLRKKYLSTAQATDKLLADNGGMKVQMEAIKDAVEFKAGVTRDAAKKHPSVGLMIAQQQQKFQRLVTQYATSGDPDPVGSALNQVMTEFEKVQATNNAYSHEFKFGGTGQQVTEQQMDYRIRFMDDHLKSYGNEVLDMPNTLFNPTQLQSMVKGYGSEGWKTDPQINYLANKLGVDPLTVLNRQLEANGMDSLPPSPAIEAINQLTPTQQNLINKFKTESRTERGLSGLVSYTPELVPGGYGQTIASAAKKYGIDPSILAGLIDAESAFNPNAISQSGAEGLGQFMPATAAEQGVDVNDPISSINGAAKYLAYLRDYFGGDMEKAIYAYNGGMGNIQRYGGPIPGNRENQEYYKKVIRKATKYGYGKQALKDPATPTSFPCIHLR